MEENINQNQDNPESIENPESADKNEIVEAAPAESAPEAAPAGAEPAAEEISAAEAAVILPREAAEIVGERKWYVIQSFTGQEDKAKHALELTVELENLKGKIYQILVPLEEMVEIKGGKRVKKSRKMFPGYVFVDMILDDETWYQIRQTTGVARFIGTKVKPTPVSDKEMQRVLKQLGKEEKLEVTFEKGEAVRIISGAFRGYTGSVDEINAEKGKMKVLINIFGRDTPVEVNFEHAQKIN